MPPEPKKTVTVCPVCGTEHTVKGGHAFQVYVERFKVKVTCSPECQAVFDTQRRLESSAGA